jgi:hypothetical protein
LVEIFADYFAHSFAKVWGTLFLRVLNQLLFKFDELFQSKLEIRVSDHKLEVVINSLFLLNLSKQLVHCFGIVDITELYPASQHFGEQWVHFNFLKEKLHSLFIENFQWFNENLKKL